MNGKKKKPSRKEPEPGFLGEAVVGIIGLGLMGGSLGLALDNHCRCRLGLDRDAQTRSCALELKVVDHIAANLEEIAGDADVLILATPPRTNIQIIQMIAAQHLEQKEKLRVLLDIGSTKLTTLQAMKTIQETGSFACVGGHPMCGKEVSGITHADPTLFKGAKFAICPLEGEDSIAIKTAEAIALAIGANPLILSAEEHDSQVAYTSHLPFLTSAALMSNAASRFPESLPGLLAGSGFYDTTRLAGSEPHMMLDILATNQPNVIQAIDQFIHQMNQLREWITTADEAALGEAIHKAAGYRHLLFPPDSTRDKIQV